MAAPAGSYKWRYILVRASILSVYVWVRGWDTPCTHHQSITGRAHTDRGRDGNLESPVNLMCMFLWEESGESPHRHEENVKNKDKFHISVMITKYKLYMRSGNTHLTQ